MGYYTQYTLKVEGNNPTLEEVAKIIDGEWMLSYLMGRDTTKWYEYRNDMLQISALYPNVLFTLHGVGEEEGDEWVEYYKNGKHQREVREEWSPPEFNPDTLE